MSVDSPVIQLTPQGNNKEESNAIIPKSDAVTTGNDETNPKEILKSEQPQQPQAQRTPNRRSSRRQNRGRQRRQSDRPQSSNRQPQDGVGNQRTQSSNRQRQDSVGNQQPPGNNRRRQDSVGNQRPQSSNRQRQVSVGPLSQSGVTVIERVVVLKRTDMSEDMQKEAIKLALDGLKRFTVERNTAAFIKKEFDQKYGGTWHCIIGKSYGSFVTHEARHFAFFYVDEDAVLLYKTPM